MALSHLATRTKFRLSWSPEYVSSPWSRRSGLKKTTNPGTLDLQMRESRANQKWVAGDPKQAHPQTEVVGRAYPEQGRHSTGLVLWDSQAHMGQPSMANGSSNLPASKHHSKINKAKQKSGAGKMKTCHKANA